VPTTIVRSCRALALLTVALLVLTGCLAEAEQTSGRLVNEERARAGVRTLHVDHAAQAKAQAWAQKMAAQQQIFHSNVASGMGDGWQRLGENVAAGPSVGDMHRALMASGGHRARMLDGRFTHIGVGVAKGADGRLYMAQVFVTR
jgi:uncharacterized protein YkwD